MTDAVPTRVLSLALDGVLHPRPLPTSEQRLCWVPSLRGILIDAPDVVLLVHSPGCTPQDVAELREALGPLLGSRLLGVVSGPAGPHAAARAWVDSNAPGAGLLLLDVDRTSFGRDMEWDVLICDPSMGISDPDILCAIAAGLTWVDWAPPQADIRVQPTEFDDEPAGPASPED